MVNSRIIDVKTLELVATKTKYRVGKNGYYNKRGENKNENNTNLKTGWQVPLYTIGGGGADGLEVREP